MISLILASILCTSTITPIQAPVEQSALVSAPKIQIASNLFRAGTDVVEVLRQGYSEGEYRDFLKKMDTDYALAKKESALEGLIEIRKESARAQIHPEFARSYRAILDTKNQQLLEAVKGSEDSVFFEKVRSAAASLPAYDDRVVSLNGKAPGAGKNSDENRLIDIDLEYYYKGIHLDSTDQKDRRDKHMVLEMEKADRMVKASQSFEDMALKTAVYQYATVLDERLSRNYDMMDLHDLARGKIKPISTSEKEAAAAISRAQGSLADLHRHLLDSLDENGQSTQ